MTDDELAEIEARASAATSGPWRLHGVAQPEEVGLLAVVPDTGDYITSDWDRARVPGVGAVNRAHLRAGWDNALFVAHARTDVPRLVAEVRRLRARLEEVKDEIWAWSQVE